MQSKALIFGPAYLDRVLRVDSSLADPACGAPIDQSLEALGGFTAGATLELVDEQENALVIQPPDGWPGPTGRIRLRGKLPLKPKDCRGVSGLSWSDDLGGMGAGFAAALSGTLISALGAEEDPISAKIAHLIQHHEVDHRALRVPGQGADWTLLVTSGAHGDKLAVGFRGCHAALEVDAFEQWRSIPTELRVVAGLPNRLSAHLLAAPGAGCRMFAPAMRNMRDREVPIASFASSIDLLCCNRIEWETLEDREEVAWRISVLIVTDGPAGSRIRFTTPQGEPGMVRIPAFPRGRPPRDTNRAGESFASTLISTLLSEGWQAATAVVDPDVALAAMRRASAAAALTIDRLDFGFPEPNEVDRALDAGRVE